MTASWMVRSFAGTLLAVCAAMFALPGCGSSPTQPVKKEDKKDDTKAKTDPKPDPNVKPPETPPKTTLGAIEPAADQFQTAFLRDLLTGNVKAEALSKDFIKVIGKPVKLPSDKEKGYSEDNALSWLKRVGTPDLQILPAMYQKQAGDVVYIRGLIGGQRLGKEMNTGGYSLRLVKEGGAWKVDWLSLSSAKLDSASPTATPEGAAQEFAVVSFVESVADLNGMPKEYHERTHLIAAALNQPLRAAWGEPFGSDKADGLDFNPEKLQRAATQNIGGGTSKFSVSRIGESSDYKVELTKPAGKKIYTVKLVRGTRPHEWLVSEVTEQKG